MENRSDPLVLATARTHPQLTASDALLRHELESRGVVVDVAPWDQIAPTPGCRVCVRSTWDYHHRPEEFRAWVQAWMPYPDALANPPATMLWNVDKRYLLELAAAGVAIPETRVFEPGESPSLPSLPGQAPVVVKPRISATALGTHLVHPQQALTSEQLAPLLRVGSIVQAFVADIATAGELSLVYFAGRFSHAVRKRAAVGDFRVQSDFGGTVSVHAATAAERAFADHVLSVVSLPWRYARVDVVASASQMWLMELELIEPELFLTTAPDAASRFADALLERRGPR